MPRVLNPLPLEQRCTRCRHRARVPGSTSCEPCATKRREAMRVQRAAAREAAARERTTAQSGYPDAHNGQNAQPHNRSDKSNERSNGENVPAADALMGVFGMARESHGQERIPVQEKAPEDCSPRASNQGGPRLGTSTGTNDRTSNSEEQAPKLFRGTDVQSGGLILVVPDLHAPLQDERSFRALLAMMAEHKFAELVLLGDAVELVSCSWFGGPAALKSYKDECAEARTVIKRLLALHEGPVTLTVGNHDGRPDQKVEKSAPQLHGSIVDEMRWDELGVTVIPEDQQPITRGRLRLLHGHQDSGRFPALYHARKMCDLYGLPGQAVIYGHTHKDQTHSRPMHGGPARAYGLGCLEKRPQWLKSCDAWTSSVAVADPSSGAVNVLPIVDGVMVYGGRCYRG